MLSKLFKKKEVTTSNGYSEDVLKIHHEFKTASEELLKEAMIIINDKVNMSKVDLLKSLGFNQAREVVETEPKIKKIQLSQKQVEYVQKYKIMFPTYKFITEEQIEHICHKYGLVFGDVQDYKGFVPEKNLKEIQTFLSIYNKKLGDVYFVDLFPYDKNLPTISNLPLELEYYKSSRDSLYQLVKVKGTENRLQQNNSLLIEKGEFYGSLDLPDGTLFRGNVIIKKNVIKIAAPLKDMDITDKTIEKGYKLINIKKEIPDPVIFHPVEGGYMISTMWADEQFDPSVEPMLRNDELNN